MGTMVDKIVENLRTERPDHFDQGVRQAAAFAMLLQGPPPLGSIVVDARQLTDLTLATIGRVLECSLEYRNDPRRHAALRSVAAALAQALVGSPTNGLPLVSLPHHSAAATESSEDRRSALLRRVVTEICQEDNYGDWDAAGIRSLQSLLSCTFGGGGGTYCNRENALGDLNIATSIESMSQAVLEVPWLDPITGTKSVLVQEFQGIGFPWISETQVACTARLLLDPQALNVLLSDVLESSIINSTTASSPLFVSLQTAIASRPDWALGISSIAATPALHLAARTILRAWLAGSGNIHAWLLHYELFKQATKVLLPGLKMDSLVTTLHQLYIYPAQLKGAAEAIHAACSAAQKPKLEALNKAVHAMEQSLKVKPVGGECYKPRAQEEVWSLLLDVPMLIKYALKMVPWRLIAERHGVKDTELEALKDYANQLGDYNGPVPESAAILLSRLMWPFHARQQRAMRDALMLLEPSYGFNAAEIEPWVTTLWQWHQVWSQIEI